MVGFETVCTPWSQELGQTMTNHWKWRERVPRQRELPTSVKESIHSLRARIRAPRQKCSTLRVRPVGKKIGCHRTPFLNDQRISHGTQRPIVIGSKFPRQSIRFLVEYSSKISHSHIDVLPPDRVQNGLNYFLQFSKSPRTP